VWWDILLSLCWRFAAARVGERMLKIGQHLAKLRGKNIAALFSGHVRAFLRATPLGCG